MKEVEKEKRQMEVQREKEQADFARKGGSVAFRVFVKPQYYLDTRLNVHRECNIPPESLYMGLGWDETPEDERKHYRKYYTQELEFTKDVMPVETPFDQFHLKRGQTRGASKSLNPFASKKTDESGQVSTE